ncbi:armadillo-type protein [Cokeromyces recurvatus]|uniref:armadillo-type protein n=1 Tax=Cokeromyces recurvatus TaxID=90255 RepID=UPI002221067A|nr:armadillo-type protein [Cokeromyces recurvatus]KAI7902841.1 armadillo-type protein [Cokeromyces recurvatus]
MPELWYKLLDTFKTLPLTTESLKFIESFAVTKEQQSKDIEWWKMILEDYLQRASIHEQPFIRAAACDCFASMPQETFELFHYRHQRLIITLLLSLVVDENIHVKGAACRALGIFILFPSLREDPMFVSDMAKSILSQKEDKAILVRIRASWAIANLCDALVLESEKSDFNLREYMSTTEWIDLLSIVTTGAVDNEKLRSNAVRAIGSLLRITPKEYFENTRMMSLVRNAIMQGLVKNIEAGTSLKIRWNASHAASNMLLNPYFPIGDIYPWTNPLYQALIKALLHCKNFKVRINACLALTTPKKKSDYGNQLPIIVESILEAWKICQENHGYKEVKYKEQFEHQVRNYLCAHTHK